MPTHAAASSAKRAAAAVNSKYVVSTYEVYEQPIPYLVMEYVAGKSLQDHLDQLKPFATRDILRIGAEIAEGLAAAHQQGLIHRDVKPANILLRGGPLEGEDKNPGTLSPKGRGEKLGGSRLLTSVWRGPWTMSA